MERQDGPQTPYEVYCYNCRVTFPAEARRCVHCGGRLGHRGAPRELRATPELHVEQETPEVSIARRVGGLSLWLLVAVAAVISRMCSGG